MLKNILNLMQGFQTSLLEIMHLPIVHKAVKGTSVLRKMHLGEKFKK